MLSVKVFQEGEYFGWTLNAPSNEVLGHGTAETVALMAEHLTDRP